MFFKGALKAFHALTPGRQRGYVLHFTGAKQPQTRTARIIERCIPKILAGRGMHDDEGAALALVRAQGAG